MGKTDCEKLKNVWVFPHSGNADKIREESLFESDFKFVIKNLNESLSVCNAHQTPKEKSFHELIYPVILLAQFFGIMPVQGIGKKVTDLKFNYCKKRIFFCGFVFLSEGMIVVLTLYWILRTTIDFGKMVCLVFYSANVTALILFFFLAMKWPKLMMFYEQIENKIPKNISLKENILLGKGIKIITIIVMVSSFIEHTLAVLSSVYSAYKCFGLSDSLEAHFTGKMSQVFYVTNYHLSKGIFLQIINFYCTFTWNFMDLFIMLMSYGLTKKFNQVNKSMMSGNMNQKTSESFWITHRIHYNNICELIRCVDKELGYIVLLSFANNLFFICTQLLNGLNLRPGYTLINDIYYWFSMVYLIGRTLAVCLFSSFIYDESRKPIVILHNIPADAYNSEVKRFLNQVVNDKIALTGKKFFYLTRGLILTIAGTIVTYELVLVQFNIAKVFAMDTNQCVRN